MTVCIVTASTVEKITVIDARGSEQKVLYLKNLLSLGERIIICEYRGTQAVSAKFLPAGRKYSSATRAPSYGNELHPETSNFL